MPDVERPEADLELVRTSVREDGAFGVLQALDSPRGQPGRPIAVCLERTYPLPDAPSGAQFLKIPIGLHRCVRTVFHRGGYETFEVIVPGHDRLLFHVANVEQRILDLDGCVGVARRFGLLNGQSAILDSRLGFEDFMTWAGDRQSLYLQVRHA